MRMATEGYPPPGFRFGTLEFGPPRTLAYVLDRSPERPAQTSCQVDSPEAFKEVEPGTLPAVIHKVAP
jgi:hypothetical protein